MSYETPPSSSVLSVLPGQFSLGQVVIVRCKKQRTIKRKKRSHKGRGLATRRRRKIDAMIAVELRPTARNSSHFEDSSPIPID